MVGASLYYFDGGLYGFGPEPVQGFLAGISWIGACGDRRTGLDTVAGAGRGGSVEIL